EFRMRDAGGNWIWLRARAELVQEEGASTPRLIGIAVDVTEQKLMAARSATADLRLTDAIEAISEAFVLWDEDNRLVTCNSKFRTPLNAIIGFSDTMQRETFGALGCMKYVEYCRGINESGQYLLGVISDVLAMSELEAGHTRLNKTRLEIDSVLEQAVKRIEPAATKRAISIRRETFLSPVLYGDRPA